MEIVLKEIDELRKELKAHQQRLNETFPRHGEILTYEQTMELLNCSRNSLDNMRRDGIIKVYRLKGRLYCKYSELLAALDAQLIPAGNEKQSINPTAKIKNPASLA